MQQLPSPYCTPPHSCLGMLLLISAYAITATIGCWTPLHMFRRPCGGALAAFLPRRVSHDPVCCAVSGARASKVSGVLCRQRGQGKQGLGCAVPSAGPGQARSRVCCAVSGARASKVSGVLCRQRGQGKQGLGCAVPSAGPGQARSRVCCAVSGARASKVSGVLCRQRGQGKQGLGCAVPSAGPGQARSRVCCAQRQLNVHRVLSDTCLLVRGDMLGLKEPLRIDNPIGCACLACINVAYHCYYQRQAVVGWSYLCAVRRHAAV